MITLKQRMRLYESRHKKPNNILTESEKHITEADIPETDPMITPPVEEETHETPEVTATPEENGIQNMLQFLIKDEWDAIEGYNNTIQTLKDMGGYDDLCGVLQEISNEELVHVGQLQKALEFVNPVTAKIKEGETEATEQMTEPHTEGE
jgi:rubrerythrin